MASPARRETTCFQRQTMSLRSLVLRASKTNSPTSQVRMKKLREAMAKGYLSRLRPVVKRSHSTMRLMLNIAMAFGVFGIISEIDLLVRPLGGQQYDSLHRICGSMISPSPSPSKFLLSVWPRSIHSVMRLGAAGLESSSASGCQVSEIISFSVCCG